MCDPLSVAVATVIIIINTMPAMIDAVRGVAADHTAIPVCDDCCCMGVWQQITPQYLCVLSDAVYWRGRHCGESLWFLPLSLETEMS